MAQHDQNKEQGGKQADPASAPESGQPAGGREDPMDGRAAEERAPVGSPPPGSSGEDF
jgi:hypothetical protein